MSEYGNPWPWRIPELVEEYAISKRVNDPSTDDSPDVIDPVDVGDQTGLEEFE